MTPSEDKNRVCGFGLHRNIFRKTSKTKTTAQERYTQKVSFDSKEQQTNDISSLVPDNPPANKQQNPEQTPNPHAKTLDSAHKEPFRPKFYFPPGYRPKPQLEMGQSGSQTPEAERKPTPIFVDGKLVAIPKSKMSESGERNIVTPKKPSPKLKDVADTGKENAPHGSPTRSMPGAFPAASSSAVAIFPKAFGLDQSNSNSKVSEESSKAVETGFIKFESPLSPSVVNNDFDSSPKYCPPSNLGLPKYGFDFGKADKNYEVPRGGFSFGDGPTSSASAASSALTSKTLFESSLASIAQPTTSLFRPTGVFQQGQSKSNLGPFNNATPSQASQGEGSQLFDSTTTSTTNQTGNKIFSNIPMSDDRRDHLESRSKKQRQGSRNIDFTAQPTQSVEPTSTVENPFRHLNPEQNHMVEKPSLKAARDPKVSATSNERLASWARVPAFTTSDGPSDLPFNNLSLNVATNTTSTTTAPTAHTNPKPSMSTMVDTSVQTMTSRPDTISLDEHVRWLDRFIHVKMPTSVHPSAHAGVLPVPVARQILNNKAGEFAHARRTAGNLADANKAELSSAEVDNGYEKGDRYAKLLHMKTELAKEMSEAERAFAEWKADDEMFTGLKDERDRFLRELTELRQSTSLF